MSVVRRKKKEKSEKQTDKDGRIFRNRTINPDLPSTSHVEENEEELDADEFTCKICYKQFKNYNQIKAHKLLCTVLKKKYVYSVCSKGFTQKSLLEDHYDYRHTNQPRKYICKHCQKDLELKKVFQEHNR